jgi:LPS sulfotransferase NodH
MAVAPPLQSYILWFSQRVGSTLLTQTLEDTGIAGRPREWFTDHTGEGILAKYGVTNAFELREVLWREGTTANGVIGVKYGMGESLHQQLTSLFTGVIPGEPDPDGRKAWEAFYPRCQHVFLTRRNKFRLAVSWWRAIRSAEWHRPNRSKTVVGDAGPEERRRSTAAEVVDAYDYESIEYLFAGACLREAAMQDQFDRWGVIPYTIVYEDFVASYESTVRALLEFLQVPGRHSVVIPAPSFDRLADEASETWYQRFRHEREAKLK